MLATILQSCGLAVTLLRTALDLREFLRRRRTGTLPARHDVRDGGDHERR